MTGCGNMSFRLAIALFGFLVFCQFSFNGVQGETCSKKSNTSCGDCTSPSSNCYWCSNNQKCGNYDPKKLKDQVNCQGSDMYYRQCLISGKLLIIIVPSVVGGVLLILGCLIYCCCCRRCRGRKDKYDKEDKKLKKERSERKQIYDHRKAEREARNEDIRMKYGLKPAPASGESRYQRLGDNYP